MAAVAFCIVAHADVNVPGQHYELLVGGKPWLSTVTTPYDPATKESKAATFKVFTHILDFEGKNADYQRHRRQDVSAPSRPVHRMEEDPGEWEGIQLLGDVQQGHRRRVAAACGLGGNRNPATPAHRSPSASIGAAPKANPISKRLAQFQRNRARTVSASSTFSSTLTSVAGKIELRGDLQHAGMQIRLADEIANGEGPNKAKGSATYVLPKGIVEQKDNKVEGAWWVVLYGGNPRQTLLGDAYDSEDLEHGAARLLDTSVRAVWRVFRADVGRRQAV